MSQFLPIGKLPSSLLSSLLARVASSDPRVVVGPGIGQDAAVIDMHDHYLVAKTDPITFATDEIGWYAVNVNANDIACMGAHPKWFMATALLPAGQTDAAMVETIFDQLVDACRQLDIVLVGGHTEITHELARPILMGAMLGEVAKENLVTSKGAHVGDVVVLTKAIPLEGTSLIAREKENALRGLGFADDFIDHAKNLLHTPGISVVREALIAADAKLATAMHDPTEGGLATGLWELAQAAQVGLTIDGESIPILPEGIALYSAFELDPLGVIASGALLVTTPANQAAHLIALFAQAQIQSTIIGRVVPREEGVTLIRNGQRQPLPRFAVDEIARLFE